MHTTVHQTFRHRRYADPIVYRGLQGTLPFGDEPDSRDTALPDIGRDTLLRARGALLKRLVTHKISLADYRGAIALLQALTQ